MTVNFFFPTSDYLFIYLFLNWVYRQEGERKEGDQSWWFRMRNLRKNEQHTGCFRCYFALVQFIQ